MNVQDFIDLKTQAKQKHAETHDLFFCSGMGHGVEQVEHLLSADLLKVSAIAKQTASKTRLMASCRLSRTSFASSEQTSRNVRERVRTSNPAHQFSLKKISSPSGRSA